MATLLQTTSLWRRTFVPGILYDICQIEPIQGDSCRGEVV